MANSDNPYRSPQISDEPNTTVSSQPGEPIVVTLVRSGLLYRCLQLSGGIQAELEWSARSLVEKVLVNGIRADSKTPFWYARHFSFVINATRSRHQFDVDVRIYWFAPIIVRAFRLRIDDKSVYSEGRWAGNTAESPSGWGGM